MARSKILLVFVTLLSLVLVGTVIVLSTVVKYFGIDQRDVVTEAEMRLFEGLSVAQSKLLLDQQGGAAAIDDERLASASGQSLDDLGILNDGIAANAAPVNDESPSSDVPRPVIDGDLADKYLPRIPKIIHQTWKSDVLPERWEHVRRGCLDLHPEYEYKLWSDNSSREFIADHYPWFLPTFDSYPYPIQRADVIRYFVLHHYGGVYMDLDIGCKKKMDPLLYFPVVLPATIPVGVSNDLMLAEKGHPFMDLVIHNLVTFNHQYGTNYPTVMFSTGPMFLSAQYGLYPRDEAAEHGRRVRILPRRWYGKNAPVEEMGDSFFIHFYGSSWHADDAGFITFLGKFGMILMYTGAAVVVLGTIRLLWSKARSFRTPKVKGPIALPLHFGAEGVSSPTLPHGGHENRGGVLYYLPVWMFPNGETQRAGPSFPSSLSGLFFRDQDEHAYQPVPSLSRPPSPSSDSILHAPGVVRDGAFDGVNLHSVSGRRPGTPRTTVAPPSPPPPPYQQPSNQTIPKNPFNRARPRASTVPSSFGGRSRRQRQSTLSYLQSTVQGEQALAASNEFLSVEADASSTAYPPLRRARTPSPPRAGPMSRSSSPGTMDNTAEQRSTRRSTPTQPPARRRRKTLKKDAPPESPVS